MLHRIFISLQGGEDTASLPRTPCDTDRVSVANDVLRSLDGDASETDIMVFGLCRKGM